MNALLVRPANEKQDKALRAVFDAMQVAYDEEPEMEEAEQDSVKAGKTIKMSVSGTPKKKPSDFFGLFTKEEGEQFETHIKQIRSEWDRNS